MRQAEKNSETLRKQMQYILFHGTKPLEKRIDSFSGIK